MKPEERDAAYLWDMVRAGEQAGECVKGRSFEAFLASRIHVLALERTLEILGEAARRVTEDVRVAHPEIAWKRMIAQRNVIAHEYGDIDHKLLYVAVIEQLPKDLAILRRIVKGLEDRT